MISVITVCYNSAKTIKRTIESVLCQKGIPDLSIEHIFVDGKSQDDTLFVINSYRNAYKQQGIKMIVISESDEGI